MTGDAERQALWAVRGVLVDLDGVVYVGDRLLPGARSALDRLRAKGYALRFLTNTSTKPVSAVEEKLRRLGVRVEAGEVVSAVRSALLTLRRLDARSPYLVVGEEVREEFAELAPVAAFPGYPAETPGWIVIGDIGARWDYELVNRLFGMITGGARLLALHKGRAWQTADGLAVDIGAFVAGLEYATGVEALVTGKPAEGFFRAALDDIGCAAGEALMVGDDIESDVGGAQAAGVRGVLVRTGKFREESRRRSRVEPWRIIDSLAEINTLLDTPVAVRAPNTGGRRDDRGEAEG